MEGTSTTAGYCSTRVLRFAIFHSTHSIEYALSRPILQRRTLRVREVS